MNFPKIKNYYQKLKGILGLSLSLAKARFKLKNEGSYLGILWYLLNPLAMFLILLFLRDALHKTSIDHYPIYLFLGLIMFNFFRQATNSSSDAISHNAGFIKSLKINYEPFVISTVLQSIFSHIFEIIILIIFMIYFKISLVGIMFYPFAFLPFVIFTLGACFLLAVIGAYVADLANAWSVFLNALWFATPIYYVVSSGSITFLNEFNPLYYFLDFARQITIYGSFPDPRVVAIIIISSVVLFFVGLLSFIKYKKKFAELI